MTLPAKTLTEQTIKDLSGDAVFQRGYVYYNEGRARIVSQSKTAVNIVVQGNQEYAVKLSHTSKQFEASCECPAAQGFDFCKHCVTASLLYIEQLSQKETLKNSSGSALLQAYLASLPKEQLVNALADHISRNAITLQNWMLRAETAAEKLDARALKKHITAAIPYNRDLHRYPQVQAYFKKIEALLERLEMEEKQLEPDQMLKLVDYAITRIRRAMETIEDSGGYRYQALETLAKLHGNALEKSLQSHRQKAEYLVRIYLSEESGFYPEIPEDYVSALGKEAVAIFYQRLHQRWESLPELNPDGSDYRHFDRKLDYLHTLAPLLKKVRADKDLLKEARYLEKCATNVRDMVALSALYGEAGSITEAHSWLTKAESLSDRSGVRGEQHLVVDQKVEMHILENKPDQAMALRWQRFEKRRNFKTYLKLKEVAERLDSADGVYAKALSVMQKASGAFDATHLANAIVRIHIHEDQYAAACLVANDSDITLELLEQISVTNIAHHEQTLPLLRRAVEMHLRKVNSQGYEDTVRLLKKVNENASKKDRKHLKRFIEDIKEAHKAKRNFISLVEQEFDFGCHRTK